MILASIAITYVIGCIIVATFIQLNYNYFELYEKLDDMNSMLSVFIDLDNEEVASESGVATVLLWPVIFVFWWILIPIFLVIITTPYNIIEYFIEKKSK